MPRPQELIATAVRALEREVPALARLKLAARLELRGRGDVQVFRVRMPAPEVTKGEPDDARLEISMSRAHFNELAERPSLARWREAYESGHVKIGGDPEIRRVLATVIERQMARSRLRRAH
jgi:hypothetical protein